MLSHKIQIINIRENCKISKVNKNLPEIVNWNILTLKHKQNWFAQGF